ncbi:Hsp20/alpha crystallin family protein [Gimesia benthica]|uniref:Hsp20/alpha crystallin family protein n=2 Tax=Gimesia benthica TaxID=2608982 RepID=A0A6I6ABY9_9PLAN|nr:Hsp20/alpha crystallin family protein [Gimesia benthica]
MNMTTSPELKGTVMRANQSVPGGSSFPGRAPFGDLRSEMEKLLNTISGAGGITTAGLNAALDISETEDAVEVRMDVPGIEPDEIEVEVVGELLRITGERKAGQEEKGKTWHRVERSVGSFARSIKLPCEVESEHIEANCERGVLTIVLPKSQFNKPRKIQVKPKS